MSDWSPEDLLTLRQTLIEEAHALGFSAVRISRPQLTEARQHLDDWLARGFSGEMHWFKASLEQRSNPQALMPGTTTVISLTLPYLHHASQPMEETLKNSALGYISRYALGRDYHKVVRRRLKTLADRMSELSGASPHRVFTDSAPVMEVEIARQGGLGWRGKHTLLLNRQGGSWFFLGEIYTPLPLPIDAPTAEHCGRCTRCLEVCPTQAIVAPYQVDARRCISYLTIENPGAIPVEFRKAIGNRIYGCDDCQLYCPWNDKTSEPGQDPDFAPRHQLDRTPLIELFQWTESDFYNRMLGSPIRRIGYERWLRNIAVALGNGPKTDEARTILAARWSSASPLLREHIEWALLQLSDNS